MSTPKRCPALAKAGCAVSGLIMFGRADVGIAFAVGEHGVGDRSRAARGDEAGRIRARQCVGTEQVQGHGDDLGLELRGARTHVALECVHVGEVREGLVEEVVVIVVAAVHRPRALTVLPHDVLARRHVVHHREDVFTRRT